MAEPGAEGGRPQAALEPRRVPDSRLPADSAPGAVQAGPGETSGGVRGPGTPGTPAGGARPVQEPADAGGPVSDGGLPQASKDGGPPTARPASGLRETGILILTPYGPRWVEQALPVDPALRSTEPVKPSASAPGADA